MMSRFSKFNRNKINNNSNPVDVETQIQPANNENEVLIDLDDD